MKIEYSSDQSRSIGPSFVYGFHVFEQVVLISGIPAAIKKLERRIEKIENHPKNDGQVTYKDQIHELEVWVKDLKEIQETFQQDIDKFNKDKPKSKQARI